jgi:hypothetical protein
MIRAEMLKRMSAEELHEWMIVETIESEHRTQKPAQTPEQMLAELDGL